MAVTGSTITSTTLVGVKEDVSDVITNISPTETPFLTLTKTGPKPKQTLFSWLEDSLAPPGANAAIEGADAPAPTYQEPATRQNTTQIMTKSVKTTGTADEIQLYGRGVEFAYVLAKKAKEIKRDLEYALVYTRQTLNNAAGTARTFAGVQAQILPSQIINANNGVLSEANVMAACQLSYDVGAEPSKLLTTSQNATVIADFAGSAGRYRDLKDVKKIVNAVDVYVSPFGVDLTVVIDRYINPSDTLVIDPAMWAMRWLRPWFTKKLAETGDAHQSELIGEVSLEHKNYLADTMISNVNAPVTGTNTAGTTAATLAPGYTGS